MISLGCNVTVKNYFLPQPFLIETLAYSTKITQELLHYKAQHLHLLKSI